MKGEDLPPMVYYLCDFGFLAKRGKIEDEHDIYHFVDKERRWERFFPGKRRAGGFVWFTFFFDLKRERVLLTFEDLKKNSVPQIENILTDKTSDPTDWYKVEASIIGRIIDADGKGEMAVSEKEQSEEFVYYESKGDLELFLAKKGRLRDERDIYYYNHDVSEWVRLYPGSEEMTKKWRDYYGRIGLGELIGVKKVLSLDLEKSSIPPIKQDVVDITSRIKYEVGE